MAFRISLSTAFVAMIPIVASLTPCAHGAFVIVDDFTPYAVGTDIVGQPGWTGSTTPDIIEVVNDPADAANKALRVFGNNTIVYAHKATPQIANNTTGTLFLRFRLDNGAFVDEAWGQSHLSSSTGDVNDFKTQLRSNNNAGATDLTVRNGGAFESLSGGFSPNTWTNAWYVSDNATDTYQIYTSVGTGPATLRATGTTSTFGFRGGATTNALQAFLVRSGTSFGATYFDDIYVDTAGVNLESPIAAVPEPASLGMLAVGVVALLRRKR